MMEKNSVQTGWFEQLQAYLSPTNLVEKIKESKETIIDIALYLGIGFLLGFLFKRYSNYFAMFGVLVIAVIILQYYDIMFVIIKWDKVQDIFGLHTQVINQHDSIFTILGQWIQLNAVAVVSFVVGLLFGYKMA